MLGSTATGGSREVWVLGGGFFFISNRFSNLGSGAWDGEGGRRDWEFSLWVLVRGGWTSKVCDNNWKC